MYYHAFIFLRQVKWADAEGGQGEHHFEYNHGPPKGYKPEPHERSYPEPQPAYSEPELPAYPPLSSA